LYLKALEIQGFKSFPEKTLLTFEKDITAIVGPNGSGKSNISDAIRWVMGEQSSRNLRGGKMEDVIFGGTEKRGQVGFAEVSLIIDNAERIFDTDHMEVMITRRYYRSGESEYYINRETVRLRDIHELLMDTGLGREGYGIIDQGRIAEILSLKSVDRRDIFEEAAGISRFRHRKEESERKLEKTEENLTRIRDKIAELELQVEPLREQSKVAKKYLLLRDELRGVEVSLWLETLEGLRATAIKLTAEYDAARERLAEVQETLEQMYKSAETFSERMREKDLQAETLRSAIAKLEADAGEVESAIAVLGANLESNTATIDRMTLELSEQESRTDTLSAQIEERTGRIAVIETEKGSLTETRTSLLAEMDKIAREMGDHSSEMELIVRQESAETQTLAEKRERLSALASTIQELYDRENSLTADLAAAKERMETSAAELAASAQSLEKTRAEAESLANMISGHTIRLKSRQDRADALKAKVMNLTMEHGAIRSRISLLSDMEREYQGFSKSVRLVMQEAKKGILKNIHGPVANLVQAGESYALAIETALGAASQNIIVDTPEDGKYAIQYLKRTDGGRATFLPISSIKPYELRERGIEDEAGVVGIAVDLVRYDERYDAIYRNLLGRTVIVEEMDDAIRLSRKFGNRFRTVTLDGQVINAGGSMSGGSVAKNTGIISRANEIKRLGADEKKLAGELLRSKEELQEAERQLTGATAELDAGRNELRQLEDAVLALRAKNEALETRKADDKLAAEACGAELRSVGSRITSGTADIGTLKEEISASEERLTGYRGHAQELTRGSEGLSARRAALSDELGELQAKVASLEAEQTAAYKSIEELTGLSGSLTGDRDQKNASIRVLQVQNEEILARIGEKKAALAACAAEAETGRTRLAAINSEKLEMEAARTRSDRETQERNREILDMERAAARLEQKKLAADMEEKQIIDKLWDTYELTLTAAIPVRQPIESIAAATRAVAKLKKEISALGPPNIGAIDEFERVNGRYTFLTEQRDDVEKAKDELLTIIGDITGEMTEIFDREFKNIDAEFRQTFTELFGGGKAALELEDEGDILNCGIEIKVQPPGKSLKTISLLSGGEKAFTAIALYFAIQKVRPTPFCVMDEIEAALDDANVIRFAEYMRRLSGRTQFIVITHRRGTMEEADLLYGVTMQEQGISKVLHVDLEEAEKTISA